MNTVTAILIFLVMLVIIIGVYALCRKYVFSRVKINKWIPLAIAIVLFLFQLFIPVSYVYSRGALSVVSVLFFLWFMDINQRKTLKNNNRNNIRNMKDGKEIVIKPKAKPNRVKHNKNK